VQIPQHRPQRHRQRLITHPGLRPERSDVPSRSLECLSLRHSRLIAGRVEKEGGAEAAGRRGSLAIAGGGHPWLVGGTGGWQSDWQRRPLVGSWAMSSRGAPMQQGTRWNGARCSGRRSEQQRRRMQLPRNPELPSNRELRSAASPASRTSPRWMHKQHGGPTARSEQTMSLGNACWMPIWRWTPSMGARALILGL